MSIQSNGGKARAKSLSPKRRSEIASDAARHRWSNGKKSMSIPLRAGNAKIPRPMSMADYELLIKTLEVWKDDLTSE